MFIIAVEGIVYAGKTTLTTRLHRTLNSVLIPEYASYTNDSKGFPDFPPKTPEDAALAGALFTQVEKTRLAEMKARIQQEQPDFVFLDRCYLTCVAFDIASEPLIGFNIEKQSKKLWRASRKIVPDAWIYIDIAHSTAISRTVLRPTTIPSYLLDPRLIKGQRRFYHAASQCCRPWITLDGTKDPERIYEQAYNFVTTL